MPTWNDFIVAAKNRDLIRKSNDAIVMTAPKATAIPASILTGSDLTIPPAFKGLGWHSEDGLAWAREVENSEITGHGSSEPLRSDVRRVNNSLEVTALETNIQTLGMHLGVTLAAGDGSASEVVITEPSTPKAKEFRMLALSMDDTEFGEIYFGKLYAAAKVTASSPGAWSDGDNAMAYPMTISAFRDAAAGFAVQHYIGGPGFTGLREAMGWSAIP